jgi:DNA polymerase-3 subunit alpha
MNFTHLHTHSHYSLLEALPQIPDLVSKAKSLGYTSLALTDTNNLYGAIEFQKECKKAGIKSIIGCEISVAEKNMHEPVNTSTNRVFKIVLLCKDNVGYKNLIKLVSHAHIIPVGKTVPCIDLEELKKHSAGLVCMTGHIESFVWEKLRTDDVNEAEKFLNELKEIFSDDLYLEINSMDTAEAKSVRAHLLQLGKDLNIKCVATSNSHYLSAYDRSAQKVIMGISNEIDNKERFDRVFRNANLTFHSPQEIEKLYNDMEEEYSLI